MAKTGTERDEKAAVDPAPESARPSDLSQMPYFSEALSLNPMLGQPAAAMAAATVIGLGFANQMATAFFGAWQSALEATSQKNAQPGQGTAEDEKLSAAAEDLVAAGAATAESVPAVAKVTEQPKAKTVRKTATAKPAAEKTATAKLPAADAPAKVKAKPAAKIAAPKAVEPKVAEPKVAEPKCAPAKPKADTKAQPKTAMAVTDLKRISGIGPKLEGILKEMGVTGLVQVAAWTKKDTARFDTELGLNGRIERDDWVGQAKALLQ